MSAASTAVRAGLARGAIQFRQSITSPAEIFNHAFWPALALIAVVFLRRWHFGGTPLATLAVPSILGMNAAMAMVTMSQYLTADREDGTLLRAKATPHGMVGYLVGRLVSVSGGLLLDLALFFVPALLLADGLILNQLGRWLTLLWVLALALVATLPAGAVLGSAFGSSRSQGLLTLPILGVIGISGIFYPIAALPGWVQGIAQVFPLYWLGLGMRSALLPPDAVAVELGHSWRHLETVGVLGAWAVVGLLLAPVVLRRMARRESGSALAARRARALRTGGAR
ncbi:transport permease protein [Actinocatenispora thailandica]|uniref:Transport permease protein n=1 Tax=Actinocatenispora thailandica TaxID=227318 RepID=A0A7R7HYQ5_9ACTN|nr:ABC transporter permease [Actinocatenispora thailandica]BCJ37567.1 transport permease protein [Actinocatenispora thailandica]